MTEWSNSSTLSSRLDILSFSLIKSLGDDFLWICLKVLFQFWPFFRDFLFIKIYFHLMKCFYYLNQLFEFLISSFSFIHILSEFFDNVYYYYFKFTVIFLEVYYSGVWFFGGNVFVLVSHVWVFTMGSRPLELDHTLVVLLGVEIMCLFCWMGLYHYSFFPHDLSIGGMGYWSHLIIIVFMSI